jgi:hypothetical protein
VLNARRQLVSDRIQLGRALGGVWIPERTTRATTSPVHEQGESP